MSVYQIRNNLSLPSIWSALLLLFSCPVMSSSLWPCGLQHASTACPPHLPKFAQVNVHCLGDAIKPSHPLMPCSPSALNLSQHQGLFQWVGCLYQMTKILALQLQHQSFQWSSQGWFPLRLTGLISLLSKGLSGVFFSTTVQRHQFFGILPSLRSSSHNFAVGKPDKHSLS